MHIFLRKKSLIIHLIAAYYKHVITLTCLSASKLILNGFTCPSSITLGDHSLVSGLQHIMHTLRHDVLASCETVKKDQRALGRVITGQHDHDLF